MKNKEVFEVEVDGVKTELWVIRPSAKQQAESQRIYNREWSLAVDNKVKTRAAMEKVIKEQGLWTDEDGKNFEQVQKDLANIHHKLATGAKSYTTLEEAKEDAFLAREKRMELLQLYIKRNALDDHTAEGQAEIAKQKYLASECTVYNNKVRYFKSYEDFLEREEEPAANLALINLNNLMSDGNVDFEKEYPENKFLQKYGFVNDKLRRINKEGKLVDKSGRLVNEEGRWINEAGEYVDINGNRVDKDGNQIVEFEPFPEVK